MPIVSFMPDWLFFLIISIFGFLIYVYLPDELKSSIKNLFKKYGVYILLFLAWLYFRSRWGLIGDTPERWPATMNLATFYALLIFLFWQVGRLFLYEQRYYTTGFICNNLSGSCSRRQDIGDWTVFFLGTSGASDEKIVIPNPLPQKIVVVPKNSWYFLGNQIVSRTQVFLTDEWLGIYELPEEVSHFLETDTFARWARNRVYFGIVSEEDRTRDPDKSYLESLNKKLNLRINDLAKQVKGRLTDSKTFFSDTLGTVDKIRGKSWKPGAREEPKPLD